LTCLLSSFFLATIATPRENSTANQSQLVENLFDNQLKNLLKNCRHNLLKTC
jgi:hypothetical protein